MNRAASHASQVASHAGRMDAADRGERGAGRSLEGGCPRPMNQDDLDGVMSIEREVYDYPWSDGIFRDCLRAGYCCWVSGHGGTVEAYGVLSVAAGEAHLLNLCVDPGRRGRGLGKAMLVHLVGLARHHGAEVLFLEVRASNVVAGGLYEQMGFSEAGVRHGYYPGSNGREDALIMALHLPSDDR